MTKIKICGLHSVEVLKYTIKHQAEFVGLVFAKSKRQITPNEAAPLVSYVRDLRSKGDQVSQVVGVFLNPSEEQLAEVMAAAPLDIIQLHGNETPEFCRYVKLMYGTPVIKAFAIRDNNSLEQSTLEHLSEETAAKLDAYRSVIDVLLLDTYEPKIGGGSGQVFRWESIPAYRNWARKNNIQLFIAGGLHSENVQQLINHYSIDGVDVSSGVETDGIKDLGKIKSFVERVRQHD